MKVVEALLVVPLISITLSACSSSQNASSSESAPEMTDRTQVTMTVEVTPIVERATSSPGGSTGTPLPDKPTPTTSPTPALPESSEHEFSLAKLLFQGATECALPCWHQLVPGKSTDHEVDAIVRSIFAIDLSGQVPTGFQILPSMSQDLAEQYYLKGYSWNSGDSNADASFHLDLAFENATQILKLLGMRWSAGASSELKVDLTPLDVIINLGVPSYMGASPQTSERTDYGRVRLLLVYSQGAVFQFSYIDMSFDTSSTDNSAVQDTHIELCLGTSISEAETDIGYILGDIYLMESFSSDLTNLAPIQASVITDFIDFYGYKPIEEVFNISPQEISDRAASEDDVCLSTTLNN